MYICNEFVFENTVIILSLIYFYVFFSFNFRDNVASGLKKAISIPVYFSITELLQLIIGFNLSQNFFNMNIYVGNLDFKVDEEDLKGIFEEYGNVSEARVITDKFSGRSKGFGFIVMNDQSEAEKAIEELSGATLENRQMVVNEAREKKETNNRRRY